MAKNFVEELKWRGMLAQIMPGTEEYLNTHMSLRMGRNLAIGWNRMVYEFCQAVSLHLISALCIGFYTVESIAHDDASHSLSFLIS